MKKGIIPTVSVVMPVCNEKLFFNESLSSVLHQTFGEIEVLIIDGSDDKELIPTLLPKDDRIRYLYREKHGIADALNFGLENSKGRYIARMDADDISLPNRFERQVGFLEEHEEADVVGTWYSVIREDGSIVQEMEPVTSHNQIVANLLFENPICHPSVMFRRRLIDDGIRYPKTTAEDYALWTDIIGKYRFANIPEVLLNWRRSDNANTNVMLDKVIDSDEDNTLSYVISLFGLSFDKYINNKHLLIKNHFPNKIRELYRTFGAEYIVDEFRFLVEIINCCPKDISREVEFEVEKRWKMFLDMIGCFSPSMRKLYEIAFAVKSIEDISIIARILDENESRRKELMSASLAIALYGMGSEGKKVLREIRDLAAKGIIKWRIIGFFDRQVRSVNADGEEYEVFEKSKLKQFQYDLIIVSSSIYYKEIVNELVEEGIERDIIQSSSILNYSLKREYI